jgi:hypothetical protein
MDVNNLTTRQGCLIVLGIAAFLVICGVLTDTSRPTTSPDSTLGWFLIAWAVVLYFLPSLVAYRRKKKNAVSIFVVNLFLGWTLVGWVVALAWAVAKD